MNGFVRQGMGAQNLEAVSEGFQELGVKTRALAGIPIHSVPDVRLGTRLDQYLCQRASRERTSSQLDPVEGFC